MPKQKPDTSVTPPPPPPPPPPAPASPDIGALRAAEAEREKLRQSHLVDPMTHPSSGNPPTPPEETEPS